MIGVRFWGLSPDLKKVRAPDRVNGERPRVMVSFLDGMATERWWCHKFYESEHQAKLGAHRLIVARNGRLERVGLGHRIAELGPAQFLPVYFEVPNARRLRLRKTYPTPAAGTTRPEG